MLRNAAGQNRTGEPAVTARPDEDRGEGAASAGAAAMVAAASVVSAAVVTETVRRRCMGKSLPWRDGKTMSTNRTDA